MLALCTVLIISAGYFLPSGTDTGAAGTGTDKTVYPEAEVNPAHSSSADNEAGPSEEGVLISEISTMNANISSQCVELDGTPSDISAYNIDGSNYFMLRDLAQLLNGSAAQFSIAANDNDYSIHAQTGESYTSKGGEMSELNLRISSIKPSHWKLFVNGTEVPAASYYIDGSNYYRIRDISRALGFQVDYDSVHDQILIWSAWNPVVPETTAASPGWFDDAVFCGDSISTWLANYAGDAGLGKATFLTATSFGIVNALGPVTDSSVHPSYQGTKMKLEDAIVKCGATKVFLMFGINDIDYGVEQAAAYYVELINSILSKSPRAQIYIQSATPMLSSSKRADEKLNNATIESFNSAMKEYCRAGKWNYLDVASVFKDEKGGLRAEVCSDPDSMGLHISFEATQEWVNYLRTHTR